MGIKISNLNKNFGDFVALKNVNLEINKGELTALLGPSGSGKTTLLRIIAGLENADSGEISFFGENVSRKSIKERGIGFVFQHYALFRHMSVFDNIAFGLNVRPKASRPSKDEIKQRVMHLLKMIQLESLAERFPDELSGGQKQRVALARALAVEPKILLLDEPFGALDAKVRADLRRWLRKLHDEIHITSVFVTHDQEEALEVSDKIVVMNKGEIQQVGTPVDVYEKPANPFVYSFLGNVNLFRGRVGADGIVSDESAGDLLFVRPHEIELGFEYSAGSKKGEIVHSRILGSRIRLDIKMEESADMVEVDITSAKFKDIKEKNLKFVYLNFTSVHSYSQEDGSFCDYYI